MIVFRKIDEAFTNIFGSSFTFEKDPSEALCFQKIIRVESASDDVIIGCLPDYNALFQNIGDIYIYVQSPYRTQDYYKLGDRKVRYDTTQGDYRMVINPIITINTETNTVDISIADSLSRKTFGLGDADGNLFVGVNTVSFSQTLLRIAKKEVRG